MIWLLVSKTCEISAQPFQRGDLAVTQQGDALVMSYGRPPKPLKGYLLNLDLSGLPAQSSLRYEYQQHCHQLLLPKNESLRFCQFMKYSESGFTFAVKDQSLKYGLGERFQHNLRIEDGYYMIHNIDRLGEIDLHEEKPGQTYGHFPVYLARRPSGLFHLVVIDTAHPLRVKVGGDRLDFQLFSDYAYFSIVVLVGQQPQLVLRRFHQMAGGHSLPPFWAMGMHFSRWGIGSSKELLQIRDQLYRHDIPVDVLWSDIDYQQERNVFTVNGKFREIELNKLREKTEWVPILNPFIGFANPAYREGNEKNAYIKNFNTYRQFVGEVWPGQCAYIDFFSTAAIRFYKEKLIELQSKLPFSGLWIDMNQPTNFKNKDSLVFDQFSDSPDFSLSKMTLPVDAVHKGGFSHLDLHSYYGTAMARHTFQYLNKSAKALPFVLSRSTAVGAGRYAAHWTGDNLATWEFYKLSIGGNLLFNIYGIPMVGADICGHKGQTSVQLCSRWIQVGSLYPFSRFHKNIDSGRNQPYLHGAAMALTTKNSFNQRYAILKHLYSQLMYLRGEGTFYRPLFLEFPSCQPCFTQTVENYNFILSDFLISGGVFVEGMNTAKIYLPTPCYKVIGIGTGSVSAKLFGKGYANIQVKLVDAPPVFVVQGKVLFTTEPAPSTKQLSAVYKAFFFLDQKGEAQGRIASIADLNDYNKVNRCRLNPCHYRVQVRKSQTQIVVRVRVEGTKIDDLLVHPVFFWGNSSYQHDQELVLGGEGQIVIDMDESL